MYPSPGAWFVYKGERYKILNAELGFKSEQAGKVVDNNLEIACGNNKSIKVIQILRQGKNIQNIVKKKGIPHKYFIDAER